MSDLGEVLVIVHPMLAPALEQNIAEVLAPAIWRAATRSAPFAESTLRLCGLPSSRWRQLLHDATSDESLLRNLFSASAGPAIYFGMAPISIAHELGQRLGPTHRVLAYSGGPRATGR